MNAYISIYTKVEAYNLELEGCPLICRFATMGTVRSIQHSKIGKDTFFSLCQPLSLQQQIHHKDFLVL